MNQALMILTNVPDMASARAIAARLVEDNLAACVNCLPSVTSFYRWEGRMEETGEICLLIKTTAERYAQAEGMIKSLHPYELPEIIAVDIRQGSPAYLDWIVRQTGQVRHA